MANKKFIVEVPCTVVDLYVVFAESETAAVGKMRSGRMREQTKSTFGDYVSIGTSEDHEPETHWHQAKIVGVEDVVLGETAPGASVRVPDSPSRS